jgi:hypothetical protein
MPRRSKKMDAGEAKKSRSNVHIGVSAQSGLQNQDVVTVASLNESKRVERDEFRAFP